MENDAMTLNCTKLDVHCARHLSDSVRGRTPRDTVIQVEAWIILLYLDMCPGWYLPFVGSPLRKKN